MNRIIYILGRTSLLLCATLSFASSGVVASEDKQELACILEKGCTEIEVKGKKIPPYDALNEKLRKAGERFNGNQPNAPLGAASESLKVGGFNQTGLKMQFGPNYGKSLSPYRPEQTYIAPLGGVYNK